MAGQEFRNCPSVQGLILRGPGESTAHGSPSFILSLQSSHPLAHACLELLRHVLVFLRRLRDLTAEGTNKVGCFLSAWYFLQASLVPSGEPGV